MKKSELKQLIREEIFNEIKVNQPMDPKTRDLLRLDIKNNYRNQEKLIDFLGKYVTRSDIYESNFNHWENMLLYDYNFWINAYEPDQEEIESAPNQEEWNHIHDEIENKYEYNYFVRNFSVGDEEDTRHEDDINQNIEYFIDKYNVPEFIAKIMKKLVDEYLAPLLGF